MNFVVSNNWVSEPTQILDIKKISATLDWNGRIVKLTVCSCPKINKIKNKVFMYVGSVYTYLHDFKRPVENATSKSKLEYELIGVSNSTKCNKVITLSFHCHHSVTTKCKAYSWVPHFDYAN